MPRTVKCNLCQHPEERGRETETASIRCNVRKFEDELFTVWRCRSCRSIHADNEADLAHYYASYPFHRQKTGWSLRFIDRIFYRKFVVRLKRAGVKRHHRILDYGCGGGQLISYLRSAGFSEVYGYDEFQELYNDSAVLEERFDVLIAQDLIEHVLDPHGMLATFDRLVKGGGIVFIGTPDADAIDLERPLEYIHNLHQPYHTHIFSKDALIQAGCALGWSVARAYSAYYMNTLIPFVNVNFGLHYSRCFDDSLDLGFEPLRLNRKLLLSPRTPFLAFFGYFRTPVTNITVIFRKAGQESAA